MLAVYLSLGLIDVAHFPQLLMLVLYLALALVALLVLRIGLHLALLHEAHDEIQSDEPLLCTHCGHVVPDMAFCPACGVATRASSRSSRQVPARHAAGARGEPEPDDHAMTNVRADSGLRPAISAVRAPLHIPAPPMRRTSRTRLC